MAERQLPISFEEVPVIEITCLCGTAMTIPALSCSPQLKTECPGCGRSFASAAQAALGFREFYARATEFINQPGIDDNPVERLADRSIRLRMDE